MCTGRWEGSSRKLHRGWPRAVGGEDGSSPSNLFAGFCCREEPEPPFLGPWFLKHWMKEFGQDEQAEVQGEFIGK